MDPHAQAIQEAVMRLALDRLTHPDSPEVVVAPHPFAGNSHPVGPEHLSAILEMAMTL